MPYKRTAKTAFFIAVFAAAGIFGCQSAEDAPISPLPTGGRGSSELGEGVRPMSFGPGYKGSPMWSPDGARISFTVDGYVVDKPARGGDTRRWTARDFGAEEIEANTGQSMLILGEDGEDPDAPGSLYTALPSEDSPEATEVASDVLTAERVGGGGAVLAAIESSPDESTLALIRGGEVARTLGSVEGSVAGISLSPDGRQAAISVAPPGEEAASEIKVFGLSDGSESDLHRLEDGQQIFGSPQWAESGIYFVAGTEEESEDEAEEEAEGGDEAEEESSLYGLYRIPPGSSEPESAPGIGGDFTASGIRLSPDGTRLAIIGRLHANSPTDLHILDLTTETLRGATSSEDMEMRNGASDMAWAPDGRSVAVVARGSFSNPRVRAASADSLLDEFYNLYEVPVRAAGGRGE